MPTKKRVPPLPKPPPIVRKAVTGLVGCLTDVLDDGMRDEAVAVVRAQADAPIMYLTVSGLIDRLRDPSVAVERCAAEAPVGLGPVAIPPALRELARRRCPLVRARLLRALAGLGRELAPIGRLQMAGLFDAVGAGDRSGILASACRAAAEARRRQ